MMSMTSCHKGFYYYNVTSFMILSWLLLCHIFMCVTVPLHSDFRFRLFYCMTTIGVREGILLGGRKKFALKMNNLP